MLNDFEIQENTAVIMLNHGLSTIIDVESIPLISSVKWRALIQPRSVYVVGKISISKGKWKTAYMHRIISNAPKGLQVDHINGDGLDNRISNLRHVTVSQNQQNQRKRHYKNMKGTCWHARDNRWLSQICINRKSIFLGSFKTELGAHLAYCEASKKIHGDFGRTE